MESDSAPFAVGECMMGANTFGRIFSFTTFGESHGPAIGCVVDGCPAGVPLAEADIQPMLDRRRPGRSSLVSQRAETDTVRILSGVYQGSTTGHPVCLLIENQNQRSADYQALESLFRPGHADASYHMKYGIRDPRGGGRSSARETAARVAAAAVAKRMLDHLSENGGVGVRAGLIGLGDVAADPTAWRDEEIDANPLFCPDCGAVRRMTEALGRAAAAGDSLGGVVEVRITGAPAGLGEPLYDKLDARLAQALMGINAAKGVEIGDGFAAALAKGSENNDPMRCPASGRLEDAFVSNHAGGILGGISTGQPIVARVALKPTPSIGLTQQTVDTNLADADVSVGGRHDPAVAVRAVPVAEAMAWLVLADFFLLARAGKPIEKTQEARSPDGAKENRDE